MNRSPLLITLLLLTACVTPGETQQPPQPLPPTPSPSSSQPFRSDAFHLEVDLPPGWAAIEGPEPLSVDFNGLVAFNSWGDEGFWAHELACGDQTVYSPLGTLGQLPRRAGYIVLGSTTGDQPSQAQPSTPEYTGRDLSALWRVEDCRETKFATWQGVSWIEFFKWGNHFRLEVYCNPYLSDQTADQVKSLLESWRFDDRSFGDEGSNTSLEEGALLSFYH